MGFGAQVGMYSLVVVLAALGGALVPLVMAQQTRMIGFLAFAAGVMLGAAFFHMLPEAFEAGGYAVFSWLLVGFLFLFVLERYVLVHACEEPPECEEHAHQHAFGLTAFLGLSAHTLFDGVALGSACQEGVGLMALIAITAHKIPSSLSLASILKLEGRKVSTVLAYVVVFALMVPLGVVLFISVQAALQLPSITGKALAFSAGTFLYIAVSDLLPHVNRHGKDTRLRNMLSLVGGVALMLVLTRFTPEHGR